MLKRLCIIGVGLIGGSFALALRQKGLVHEIVGVDRDSHNLEIARSLGIIDRGTTLISEGVVEADCIFIATPVGVMPEIFRELAPVWQNDALYTDAGSTKGDVVAALKSELGYFPANFVPGHPIAGAEVSGAASAREGLFQGRRVILTPEGETSAEALEAIRELWSSMGARVSCMEPAHHDAVLAATSHLPHVLSFALTAMLGRHDEKQEIFAYAAGGLRDFTRIAASDPSMWKDISLANREQLVPLIEEYRQALKDVIDMLEEQDADALSQLFVDANMARQRFIDQWDK
jgi:prephenate dehydrogenase